MPLSLQLLSDAINPPADLRTRCFRAVFLVANCWMLVGASLRFFNTDGTSAVAHSLRLMGGISNLIALAIYSVAGPLYFVTRKR